MNLFEKFIKEKVIYCVHILFSFPFFRFCGCIYGLRLKLCFFSFHMNFHSYSMEIRVVYVVVVVVIIVVFIILIIIKMTITVRHIDINSPTLFFFFLEKMNEKTEQNIWIEATRAFCSEISVYFYCIFHWIITASKYENNRKFNCKKGKQIKQKKKYTNSGWSEECWVCFQDEINSLKLISIC